MEIVLTAYLLTLEVWVMLNLFHFIFGFKEKSTTPSNKREFTGMFANLKLHYFTKRTQSKEYKTQIETLLPGEVIIHVDYSENFKNK